MLTSQGCNNGDRHQSSVRWQHKNRDDAIRVAYGTDAYSYQQLAKKFCVHFTTVGRILRQPMKRVSAARAKR